MFKVGQLVDVYCSYEKAYVGKVERIENGHVYVDGAMYYEENGKESFGVSGAYFIKPKDQ